MVALCILIQRGEHAVMKLSKTTEYAIRILHYLYSYEHKEEVLTAQMISQATNMTYPYFIKVASQLREKGYITSTQGRHGGYQIARLNHKITVYDVVLAMEGDIQISTIPGVKAQCSMQKYFDQVREVVVDTLSKQYVADFSVIQY